VNGQARLPPYRALVCLLFAAWILPGLIGHDPWKPDEAYTFGLVHSLLQGGDWVVPSLAGEPFVEKPPLYYLTAAATAKLLSLWLAPHDAARLASGIYIALACLFTALTGRELYGRGRGWVSAVLLIGCFGLLVRAHQMITDTALLAGFAIGYYALALSLRRPRLAGFWLGLGGGVGFMAKGLLAPGVLGVTALALPLLFRSWRNRGYLACLGIAVVSALPWVTVWPLLLYHRSAPLFGEWFWDNNFGRFFGANELGPHAQPLQYLGILPWYGFPALPLALWVLWSARASGYAKPAIQLPVAAITITFTVLSLAADARELYAMPMLLPLALVATPAVDSLRRGAANALYWFSVMGFTFFAGVIWFYWIALEFGVPARLFSHLHAMQPGYDPGLKPLPFAFAALFTAGWLLLLVLLKRSQERPVVAWAAGLTLNWALIATLLIGWLDTGKSYRSMVAEIKHALPRDTRCIASRSLGEPQRAMLDYYAGIITVREEVTGGLRRDCNLLLIQGEANADPNPGREWRKIWEGARPGDTVERYRLYRHAGRR